jgi:hypothetical protein
MEIYYIEHKNPQDNGLAWIAAIKRSKSGQTVYFNGKSFQKHNGVYGNYIDTKTREEYWISGVKKDGTDRHWAGSGKVMIDRAILAEYLQLIGQESLNKNRYEIVDLKMKAGQNNESD